MVEPGGSCESGGVRRSWVFGLLSLAFASAPACGARTALTEPEALPANDAASIRPDARTDGRADAATADALPGLDGARRDASIVCADAGTTFVYMISGDRELFTFFPPTREVRKVGDIACPGTTSYPVSMAVDRNGLAYTFFEDGTLWRLFTGNAQCSATSYAPHQLGVDPRGMGYVANGLEDELFVSDSEQGSEGIGTIDTKAMKLSWIGRYSPPVGRCELTGTGDGRLFAFCLNRTSGSTINEIDKTTGTIIASDDLVVGRPTNGMAFAAWGGEFWIFTAGPSESAITEYDPVTKVETPIGTIPANIYGAGVSPCATR